MRYPAILRSRFRNASIPLRLQGLLLDHDKVAEVIGCTRPADAVTGYADAFRNGLILRAEGKFNTCGRGLWLRGGEEPAVVAAAILQTLLLEQVVESGLYLSIHDLVESSRPGAAEDGTLRLSSDLLVLQGVGEHYRTESGWSDSIIFGVLRKRFDRGLPTLVTSSVAPGSSGIPDFLLRTAFVEVTVGPARG